MNFSVNFAMNNNYLPFLKNKLVIKKSFIFKKKLIAL